MSSSARQSIFVSLLAVAGLVVMVVASSSPVWWVSLTAPNYPAEAFPDGIRIHFSFNGVSNGCTTAPKTSRVAQETQQEDLGWRSEGDRHEGDSDPKAAVQQGDAMPLDCMHEMNTINHYVGMHPMDVGAPVERLLGKFIIAFFVVMLLGFATPMDKPRPWVLLAGFAALTGWMGVELFAQGKFDAFVTAYMAEAGRYFRDASRIEHWGANLRTAVWGTLVFLVASMAFIVFGTKKWPRFQLVLGLVPAALPVFFVGSFAAWLWFFGHNLHPWGAFTVKPFMPTVFGDGKVAQFTTHSYPHYGFGLLGVATLLLVIAVARRRFELMDAAKPAPKAAPPPAAPAAPPATPGTPA